MLATGGAAVTKIIGSAPTAEASRDDLNLSGEAFRVIAKYLRPPSTTEKDLQFSQRNLPSRKTFSNICPRGGVISKSFVKSMASRTMAAVSFEIPHASHGFK